MKKIRKFLSLIVISVLALTVITTSPVKADASNPLKKCSDCDFTTPKVISTDINEDGNEVKTFDDKAEVTYLENGEIIIRDYGHLYDDSFNINTKQRFGWALLAKVIWNAIGGCSAVYYVTGVDACRIALSYLGTSKENNVQYELTGTYIPGKIPGCEPSYSGPCNTGYWEYRVARS